MTAVKEYTLEEVAKHTTAEDCWIILTLNGEPAVYDVTKYLDLHPGGGEIIQEVAGSDATVMFEDMGHSATAREEVTKYKIGTLSEEEANKLVKKDKKSYEGGKGGLNPMAVLFLLMAVVAGAFLFNK